MTARSYGNKTLNPSEDFTVTAHTGSIDTAYNHDCNAAKAV